MTEYSEKVKQRAKEILAEKWATKVKGIHIHRVNSMYYEPDKNTLRKRWQGNSSKPISWRCTSA